MAVVAHAQDAPRSAASASPDTEHMFGFTEGSDIGRRGDLEGEMETVGRFGRQASTYSAVSMTPTLKYGVTDQFRVAPAVTISNYTISGLDGSADQKRLAVDALSLEFRYHPLDRATAPFGLTFVATPYIGFANPADGAPADRSGALFIAVADRELIAQQLYAALNLSYQLERDHDHLSGLNVDGSTLGLNAAASQRLAPWLYVGAEVRYLRTFSGLALDTLAGQAFYVGPTFYAPINKGATVSGAWDIQAWGQAASVGGCLDLINFDRHQVKLRLSFDL